MVVKTLPQMSSSQGFTAHRLVAHPVHSLTRCTLTVSPPSMISTIHHAWKAWRPQGRDNPEHPLIFCPRFRLCGFMHTHSRHSLGAATSPPSPSLGRVRRTASPTSSTPLRSLGWYLDLGLARGGCRSVDGGRPLPVPTTGGDDGVLLG